MLLWIKPAYLCIDHTLRMACGAVPECGHLFLADATRLCLQVPAEVVPSVQQLHAEDAAEHPALVDCLLFLKGSEEVPMMLQCGCIMSPGSLLLLAVPASLSELQPPRLCSVPCAQTCKVGWTCRRGGWPISPWSRSRNWPRSYPRQPPRSSWAHRQQHRSGRPPG